VYALLAASDLDARGKCTCPPSCQTAFFPDWLRTYAEVVDSGGKPVWRSKSLLGLTIPFAKPPVSVSASLYRLRLTATCRIESCFTSAGDERKQRPALHLSCRRKPRELQCRVSRFRRSLWGWLAGAAILLLLCRARAALESCALRRVANDLHAIETGLAQRLRATTRASCVS